MIISKDIHSKEVFLAMKVKIKGISRIDSRNTHGWYVRISREGKIHSIMFSDKSHGGKDNALQEAIQYRNQYEREHPRKPGSLRIRKSILKNSSTGILGIYASYEKRAGGKKRHYFCATWSPEPYRVRNKRFYLDNYDSPQSALEDAIKFRKEREQEIIESCKLEAKLAKDINPGELMLKTLKAHPLPTRMWERNGYG